MQNLSYENDFDLHKNKLAGRTHFFCEWTRTKTPFDTEVKANLEMACWLQMSFAVVLFFSLQHAGFHHVHRISMAVRPHCVFDVVVPFHNSSQEARIPGEFCTPEHVTGGAAVGDYDGDGMEDIYFTVFHGRSVLYRNKGDI